jgi:alpha-beta hydrolase superfamily lysophospholipase
VEMLSADGYAINAFDLRGHGRTEGPRVHSPSYDALLGDIDRHIDETRARFPGVPLVLYGQSFGGAQVLCYVLKRKPALTCVVATSPGLGSGVRQPATKILAGKLLSLMAPTSRIPLGSPVNGISHDPAWIAKSKGDPLWQQGLSARLGMEMLRTNEWTLSQTSFPLPLLIMQGTDDPWVDANLSIAFARRLTGDVTLKVWEGLGHELHNELQKDLVIGYIRDWLAAHGA